MYSFNFVLFSIWFLKDFGFEEEGKTAVKKRMPTSIDLEIKIRVTGWSCASDVKQYNLIQTYGHIHIKSQPETTKIALWRLLNDVIIVGNFKS